MGEQRSKCNVCDQKDVTFKTLATGLSKLVALFALISDFVSLALEINAELFNYIQDC